MKQRGFTLIELIIVIVILGILAVTAAPKFIDIQSDAKASTLQGVKASLQTGAQLVYAKSAIAGEQKIGNGTGAAADSQVVVNNVTIETDFGYPDAELMTTAMLNGFVDLAATDWTLTVGAASATTPAVGAFGISPGTATYDYSSDTCHVIYVEAANADTPPVVSVVDTGC
ncbi:prepilin-type N-terminal cleavage/methylation domain-containing protein [Alteromonadaceae bacterium BrNp21-10]|nr:prepilin-type N-terminal cleavage/methylation domain-containing protein [Alteromonadaceae bacterium BrNp21-10]